MTPVSRIHNINSLHISRDVALTSVTTIKVEKKKKVSRYRWSRDSR